MRLSGLIIAGAVLLGACSPEGEVKLSGRFAGHGDKEVYLEQIVPGDQRVVDSTTLDKKGDFRMKVVPPDAPTLYNLRCSNNVIPLFLSPGERVTVNSIGDVAHNYTVEGSPESERMHELKMLLSHGALALDSMRAVIVNTKGDEQVEAYTSYVRETQRIMREHLAFIISQPSSFSSLYGLYQRLPNQQYLFNRDNDILYYRMVADSIQKYHPESPYVQALRREVDEADSRADFMSQISDKLAGEGDKHPDLDLPDMHGNSHRLSDLRGNVTVVDFWHSGLPASSLNNAEMRELWKEYSDRGFRVYQVSLDTNKAQWILAVQNQKLPWITVSDLRGNDSPAARQYNVTRMPTNFLLDREGNIVARDVYGEELGRQVRKLL